jgi:Cdc6-like AAA superfamily ATPase
MWDFKAPGHVCVYGGTATGKTVFMKYLIDKYTSDKSIVHIFSTSVYQWLEYPNVYTNWSDITKVKQIAAGNKETLVILDDFNDIVDTIHDKKYIELFTRGRHLGIRVLTVAHKPTSIGKDARESRVYWVTRL